MNHGPAVSIAAIFVAVCFFAFVSWFEDPATWSLEGRIVAGTLTIWAGIGGFFLGSQR